LCFVIVRLKYSSVREHYFRVLQTVWNVSERMQFETKLFVQSPQDNSVQPHAEVGK